jgi:hypothetical protein
MSDAPLPPAGWYDNPTNPAELMWWNGTEWTDHRKSKPVAARPPTMPPPPSGVVPPLRKVLIGPLILFAAYWGFQGLSGFWDGNGSSNQNTTSAISVQSARSEVQILLLGENWTGSGSYTLLDSAKAYNSTGQWWVIAARVSAPGGQLELFWSADGTNIGDGLIIGDTVTREFSAWGAAASASSEAADLVRERQNSPHGQAVMEAVGG